MEPGAAKLPMWVEALAPLILIALIFLGGIWLQFMERKARALEKERLEQQAKENGQGS